MREVLQADDIVGNTPLEIAGFGEAMVLFQPAQGDDLTTANQVEVHIAGAEWNVCAAAARVGIAAGFCSRVGADPLGERMLSEAGRLGIQAGLIQTCDGYPTGIFVKDVQSDGQRRVSYYRRGSAASRMDSSDVARLLAAKPRMIAVSGLTAALGPEPAAAVTELLQWARGTGIFVAFDPNLRPALGPLDEQVAAIRPLLSYVDILLLGIDEAGPLLGVADPAKVFLAASAVGIREAVLKAGADGSFTDSPDGPRHQPALAAEVVDPVGAGDAFAGGYLAARLRGATPAASAWLGSQLAAGVVGATGDTNGLPPVPRARELLRQALCNPPVIDR